MTQEPVAKYGSNLIFSNFLKGKSVTSCTGTTYQMLEVISSVLISVAVLQGDLGLSLTSYFWKSGSILTLLQEEKTQPKSALG